MLCLFQLHNVTLALELLKELDLLESTISPEGKGVTEGEEGESPGRRESPEKEGEVRGFVLGVLGPLGPR